MERAIKQFLQAGNCKLSPQEKIVSLVVRATAATFMSWGNIWHILPLLLTTNHQTSYSGDWDPKVEPVTNCLIKLDNYVCVFFHASLKQKYFFES